MIAFGPNFVVPLIGAMNQAETNDLHSDADARSREQAVQLLDDFNRSWTREGRFGRLVMLTGTRQAPLEPA